MTQEIVPYQGQTGLALAGNPEDALEGASRAARALVRMVDQSKSFTLINGQKHLRFEAWQTLGAFYGVTVRVQQVRPVNDAEGHILGYEADAVALLRGEVIGGANSFCLRSESKWARRDDFQIASMAQTRAMAKALRSVLAWVVVLAGFQSTPAEEMEDDQRAAAPRRSQPTAPRVVDVTPQTVTDDTPTEPRASRDLLAELDRQRQRLNWEAAEFISWVDKRYQAKPRELTIDAATRAANLLGAMTPELAHAELVQVGLRDKDAEPEFAPVFGG